jgi:hypothetical protein
MSIGSKKGLRIFCSRIIWFDQGKERKSSGGRGIGKSKGKGAEGKWRMMERYKDRKRYGGEMEL